MHIEVLSSVHTALRKSVVLRNQASTNENNEEVMTIIYEKRCPHCQGDIVFSMRLEGPSLKCLQCTRMIDRYQAREMLEGMHREAV